MNKNLAFKILFGITLIVSSVKVMRAQSFVSLTREIQQVQKKLVPDIRVAVFEVSISDTLKKVITVRGETNLPDGKQKILEILSAKGIQFVDSIQVLPAKSLGDKIWGIATLSTSNLRSEPDHAAELVSQALMGTPLKVLDYRDGWYRVQTPDYYLGWMEGSGLEQFNQEEMNRWKKSNRFVFNQISGNANDAPNKKANFVTDLVLGDLFEVVDESKGFLKIKIPDGRTGFVKKSECRSWLDWTSGKPNVQAIMSVARQLMGVPYLWGGTSCKAMDCSGLTKTSYFSQGVILARDASQQVRYGEHPDFENLDALQPGDLLFFGRNVGRVTHVGMYLGQGKYIHASGLVRINSIDPKDPKYNLSDRKSLVASSRILSSLNTEGIVLVKDHPWYN